MIHKISNKMLTTSGALITTDQTINTPSSNDNNSSAKESAVDALMALAKMLSTVQSNTANIQALRSEQNSEIIASLTTLYTNTINNVVTQIQKMEEAQENQSFWSKLVNGLMTAVGGLLTICGFPELGLPMMMIGISNLTGLSDKITEGFSKLLQDCGVSPAAADFISQLVFAAAVTVATLGMASEIGIFTVCTAVASGLAMAPHLFADGYVMTHQDEDKADLDKEKSKLDMIQGIMAAALALAGGIGEAFTASETATELTGMMKNLKDQFRKIPEFFGSKIADLALLSGRSGMMVASGIKAGCNVAQNTVSAVTNIELAGYLTELATNEANSILAKSAMTNLSNGFSQEMRSFEQKIQADGQAQANLIQSISYLNCAKELSA